MRNPAIDFLKFCAVLFIFNAHSTMLYPVCPWLATGGYIGDALFFFCSGYTLFMDNGARIGRFDVWYKRRLARIWPSCLAWGLLAGLITVKRIYTIEAFAGIGWFVKYILVCYLVLWFLGRFCIRRIRFIFIISSICSLLICFWVLWSRDGNPEHWKWPFFFPVILLGALIGKDDVMKVNKPWANLIMSLFMFIMFTGVIALGTRHDGVVRYVRLLGLPFILSFVYYAYRFASCPLLADASHKAMWKVVVCIGGLCLDFYLIKWTFISGTLSCVFPLNLPIVFLYLLVVAYLNRSIGRIIQQTLSIERKGYDWKSVFAL